MYEQSRAELSSPDAHQNKQRDIPHHQRLFSFVRPRFRQSVMDGISIVFEIVDGGRVIWSKKQISSQRKRQTRVGDFEKGVQSCTQSFRALKTRSSILCVRAYISISFVFACADMTDWLNIWMWNRRPILFSFYFSFVRFCSTICPWSLQRLTLHCKAGGWLGGKSIF